MKGQSPPRALRAIRPLCPWAFGFPFIILHYAFKQSKVTPRINSFHFSFGRMNNQASVHGCLKNRLEYPAIILEELLPSLPGDEISVKVRNYRILPPHTTTLSLSLPLSSRRPHLHKLSGDRARESFIMEVIRSLDGGEASHRYFINSMLSVPSYVSLITPAAFRKLGRAGERLESHFSSFLLRVQSIPKKRFTRFPLSCLPYSTCQLK